MAANKACRSDSVVSYGRLPTYSLVFITTPACCKCNGSDGGLERNARRRNAGETKSSDLMRKVGERSCQKVIQGYHISTRLLRQRHGRRHAVSTPDDVSTP